MKTHTSRSLPAELRCEHAAIRKTRAKHDSAPAQFLQGGLLLPAHMTLLTNALGGVQALPTLAVQAGGASPAGAELRRRLMALGALLQIMVAQESRELAKGLTATGRLQSLINMC